jgi:hypothetical protein
LGIGGSFGKEIARCYSMRSAPMSLTSAPTPLLPVKLRLKPAPALCTRRFEAQLHWNDQSCRVVTMSARERGHPVVRLQRV